jgi:Glycosyl transferases group 1
VRSSERTLSSVTAHTSDRAPRICLPTARRFESLAFQCGYLEAQDVLAGCDDVDLICLEPESGFDSKLRWLRRLMYHDVSRRLAFMNPGLKPVRLTRDYDLLVVMCATYWDFLYVNALDGWRDHCRTSVCWIDELWAAHLPRYRYWLPSLNRFDHVIVGLHGTAAPLASILERGCEYVPGATDALRFSPYPDPPERVIDIYSVGRRVPEVHEALMNHASSKNLFYLYDSLQASGVPAPDHRQHRRLYASTAKRSRFFVVAPAKADASAETRGQVEIGSRYYEGLAAGTVMIGQAPDCPPFPQMFDWPDAVVPLRRDGSDVSDVIGALALDPGRLHQISRRNARQALLRHDWAHRWRRVLEIAGLEVSPALEAREQRLKAIATAIDS